MIDTLVDTTPSPEAVSIDNDVTTTRLMLLRHALTCLNAREMRVIQSRRLAESDEVLTLQDLSLELGVSRERVRQIETVAMRKLKAAVERRAREIQGDRAPRNAHMPDFAHAA